jgi:hypothetical protein
MQMMAKEKKKKKEKERFFNPFKMVILCKDYGNKVSKV